jgi:hypothetical protein
MTMVIDRIRSLNEIDDDNTARAHLKSDIPRLRQRAKLLNTATHLALLSGMCTALLLVLGFLCALFSPTESQNHRANRQFSLGATRV